MKVRLPRHPRKRLGQNFLRDENILRKIVDFIQPLPTDLFVEIGAGTGALTCLLAEKAAHVTAIEIDENLIPYLNRIPNIRVVQGDALKMDLGSIDPARTIRICGNLPYYISTALLTQLISQRQKIRDMVLLFQEEVANRIMATAEKKDYGRLSILAQYYCRIEKGFRVGRNCFFPRPDVNSRILKFEFRSEEKIETRAFLDFLHLAFSQKRKKLRNNLLHHPSMSEDRLNGVFRELAILENARPGNLSPDLYEQLFFRLVRE